MRYNLGYMDKYPIEAAGTVLENNPMYRVVFKRSIDPIRLEAAVYEALNYFPLFKTSVGFDREYFLVTNNNPIKLFNIKEDDRPKNFGKNTNGYPWQLCYFENKLSFEWHHGVSDGVGALAFLKNILCHYFGLNPEVVKYNYLVAPGLEPFFDKKEKGYNYTVDPEGFSFKEFQKIEGRGYKTDCHELVANTEEILKCAKLNNSSVAPIIAILYSKAIRLHLPENMKNRDVACNVVLDLRRPLNYETMHNCVDYKRVTYQDIHEKMSFRSVAEDFKEKLNNGRKTPNVIRALSERIGLFRAYHLWPSRVFLHFCAKLIGFFMKDSDCNFVFTYPGKIVLPEEVMEEIENIDFKVWHDFGECIIAATDYNGKFNLNISENFVEKGIVEDFIKLSANYGIHWQLLAEGEFEQAHFEE